MVSLLAIIRGGLDNLGTLIQSYLQQIFITSYKVPSTKLTTGDKVGEQNI